MYSKIHHPEVVSRLVVSSTPSVILRVLRVLLECSIENEQTLHGNYKWVKCANKDWLLLYPPAIYGIAIGLKLNDGMDCPRNRSLGLINSCSLPSLNSPWSCAQFTTNGRMCSNLTTGKLYLIMKWAKFKSNHYLAYGAKVHFSRFESIHLENKPQKCGKVFQSLFPCLFLVC